MEVINIIEHEDGGATYQFDMTADEHDAMCRNGIMWAIVAGVTGITVEQVIKEYRDKHWEGLEEQENENQEGADQADPCEPAPDQA